MRLDVGPREWLRKSGAQGDVMDSLARYADWQTLYYECPRGDWLLGIAERLGVPHLVLVRAAIASARLADGDDATWTVLDVAEKWTEGRATEADVANATRELESASAWAVAPAREAASRAALAVGLGVHDREVLMSAPAAASESVILASIDGGFELAMRRAHDQCATAVRQALPWTVFEACVARIGGSP